MRSVANPLGTPAVTSPFAIATASLPMDAPAFTQFDPGTALPPSENNPAPETGAHHIPRTWDGCIDQTASFFAPVGEGSVQNYCGSQACSEANQGE
jgi:hypothetical protein